MFESIFNMRMFCVYILCKLFQLLMRIKSDKKIIKIPPVNCDKNIAGNQNDNEMNWLKWVLAGIPWENSLVGNNICYQM